VTGFCMGGKFTYFAAVSDVDVQCAAPFYGSAIPDLPAELHCPLLAFFGGRDEYIPMDQIEQVRARHPDDVVVYPEAQHGFMRDGSDTYDEEAAADAWTRLLAFFAGNLRGAGSG
jgi:carboxymethylenebutenolidase